MIKRKLQSNVEPKEEKPRVRKKKIKVDMGSLPDAIVDGKLVVPVKGRVFFERKMNGVTKIHEGTVSAVYEEKGVVELFDETVEQFYAFSLTQSVPVVKVAG